MVLKAISRPDRVGNVLAVFTVEDTDELMMVSDKGQTIRLPVNGISFQGRASNGVILFRTDAGERVVSVERVPEDDGGA